MNDVRRDFTLSTWLLIPLAILVNIGLGQFIVLLQLPLYLDSIGTVFVGLVAGPWAAALTGLFSNLLLGLSGINVIYAPFATVAAVIGLSAGLLAYGGWFKTWWKVAAGGLVTGLVATILAAPIATYVFGGVTGTGADAYVAAIRASMGWGTLLATFAEGTISDPLDKLITFVLVAFIAHRLPRGLLNRFPRPENVP